jgi:hypothetical protein
MSPVTELKGIHGSTPENTKPIYTINKKTHNVIK